MSTQLAQLNKSDEDILASILLTGDISSLTDKQKWEYTQQICERLKLDPFTQPFRILKQPKPGGGIAEILYATKACTEQLMQKHQISTKIEPVQIIPELNICQTTCAASLPIGRSTNAMAAVPIASISGQQEKRFMGEALCNALMKCETKATRRAVLRLMGLGMIDETEAETIKGTSADIVVVQDTAHNALNEQMIEDGGLSASQRKECIAWFRAEASSFVEAYVNEESEASLEALMEQAVECLTALKIEITEQHVEDAAEAASLDLKEKYRRQAAAEEVKGKKVAKGSGSVQDSAVSKIDASKSPAPATASVTTSKDHVPSGTSSGNGNENGNQESAPGTDSMPEAALSAASSSTNDNEAQALPKAASVPSLRQINARGAGANNATRELAPVAEPPAGPTMKPEAAKLYNDLTEHIMLNSAKGKPPSWAEEGVKMLRNLTIAAGWPTEKTTNAMLTVFKLGRAEMNNPQFFTWELLADMATYFASEDPEVYKVAK